MKRRIISLALVVALVCTLLPSFVPRVEATSQLGYTPYAPIEYGYSTETPCGTIRYMSQNPNSKYFNWSYWPTSAFGGYSSPTVECGTACISMALSYVGVNKTPKEMLEAYNGITQFIGWGGTSHSSLGVSASSISKAMDNYINGNGKYSPPVIYIQPFSATSSMHYVVLAGKISENRYVVVDPYSDSTWTVTINGSSATYHNGTNPITQVHQWYNPNATIVDTQTPGKPVLNVEVRDDQATFTWNETEHTTHYNLWIAKKDATGDWQTVEQVFYAGSGMRRTLAVGEYRAQLLSYNSNAYEADHSDWLHTWADNVYFTVEGEKTITYYDAAGNVWLTENGKSGADHTLSASYPTRSDSYFSGWAYTKDADMFQVRPGETIQVTDDVSLYPLFVSHEQAVSGEEVYIYNIADFTESGYNIEEVEHTIEDRIDTSYWTDWSDYSTDWVGSSDTVEVRTTAMYRYYYFLCPSCGAHEPFWGTSDCGANIPENTWHEKWSVIPYSQTSYKSFSYTTSRYYTESLGDGQLWIFGAANLNDTAIGTIDAYGNAEIITTGYSSRTYVEQYDTVSKKVIAYRITKAAPVLSRIEIASSPAKTVYQIGEFLDTAGLKLKLTYSDGSTRTITSGFAISGFDSATAGTKTVTVIYEGKQTSFTVTVKAAEIDENAPQIVVESKTTASGKDIVVEITAKNMPKVKSLMIENFRFNSDKLEFVDAKLNLPSAFIADWNSTDKIATVAFTENTDINGVIMTLTFHVKEGAEGEASITCDVYANQLQTSGNETAVTMTVVPGMITVMSYERGDVNGDGFVNSDDSIYLLRYTLSPSRYPLNQSGDMNGDGYVNSDDAIYLLRHTLSPTRYPLS